MEKPGPAGPTLLGPIVSGGWRGSGPAPGPTDRTGRGTLARRVHANKEPGHDVATRWPRARERAARGWIAAHRGPRVHFLVHPRARGSFSRLFSAVCALAPDPYFGAGRFEEAMREEDVPAEQPEAEEDARFPSSDAHPRGPIGDPPSARQRPRQPVGLIWRVRDREMFQALAAGRRHRSGVLDVSAVVLGPATEPPRVAFAVGRHVGGAVARNRVRRRLRAAVLEQRAELRAGWGYLVRAQAPAVHATYGELSTALGAALRAHSDGAWSK